MRNFIGRDLNTGEGVCVCICIHTHTALMLSYCALITPVIYLLGSSNKPSLNAPLPTFHGAPSHLSVLNITILRGCP